MLKTILIISLIISFYLGGVIITALIVKKVDGHITEDGVTVIVAWPVALVFVVVLLPIKALEWLIKRIDEE